MNASACFLLLACLALPACQSPASAGDGRVVTPKPCVSVGGGSPSMYRCNFGDYVCFVQYVGGVWCAPVAVPL